MWHTDGMTNAPHTHPHSHDGTGTPSAHTHPEPATALSDVLTTDAPVLAAARVVRVLDDSTCRAMVEGMVNWQMCEGQVEAVAPATAILRALGASIGMDPTTVSPGGQVEALGAAIAALVAIDPRNYGWAPDETEQQVRFAIAVARGERVDL